MVHLMRKHYVKQMLSFHRAYGSFDLNLISFQDCKCPHSGGAGVHPSYHPRRGNMYMNDSTLI